MEKRTPKVAVISDVHLGTYGCHATELLNYLKSIKPEILVLNGDIIDAWQFSKRYFPVSHLHVIKEIINLSVSGTHVVYITGNHDEFLRRYTDIQLGNIKLTDKILLDINGEKTWIFHGDVFDSTTKGSAKIIAKLGGHGYDLLILINSFVNWILKHTGRERMSFSKRVKNAVKSAVKWIDNFEKTAAELAINKGYDYVICGHIHQPQKRIIEDKDGRKVTYLNSGDWIENLTSLEFENGDWRIYQYHAENENAVKNRKPKEKLPVPVVESDEVYMYIESLVSA